MHGGSAAQQPSLCVAWALLVEGDRGSLARHLPCPHVFTGATPGLQSATLFCPSNTLLPASYPPPPPHPRLYNIKFTQWCGPLTKTFGHKATAPIKTFIDQVWVWGKKRGEASTQLHFVPPVSSQRL